MKKIELEILALSQSITQNNSYAIVLGEQDGPRRMPIIIGAFEAQAIAVALEHMRPSRPLTHDLFYSFMNTFGINLIEVIIYKIEDGIFFAQLVCLQNHTEIVEIDSRTSDAIAMAVRAQCKIYTYENILESAGIYLNNEERPRKKNIQQPGSKEGNNNASSLGGMSLEELETLLQEILEQEDYVRAIAIRDEINKRQENR